MTSKDRMHINQESARLSDVSRLASELQASAPGMTRTEALREAERIQYAHGMGLRVKPLTNSYAD